MLAASSSSSVSASASVSRIPILPPMSPEVLVEGSQPARRPLPPHLRSVATVIADIPTDPTQKTTHVITIEEDEGRGEAKASSAADAALPAVTSALPAKRATAEANNDDDEEHTGSQLHLANDAADHARKRHKATPQHVPLLPAMRAPPDIDSGDDWAPATPAAAHHEIVVETTVPLPASRAPPRSLPAHSPIASKTSSAAISTPSSSARRAIVDLTLDNSDEESDSRVNSSAAVPRPRSIYTLPFSSPASSSAASGVPAAASVATAATRQQTLTSFLQASREERKAPVSSATLASPSVSSDLSCSPLVSLPATSPPPMIPPGVNPPRAVQMTLSLQPATLRRSSSLWKSNVPSRPALECDLTVTSSDAETDAGTAEPAEKDPPAAPAAAATLRPVSSSPSTAESAWSAADDSDHRASPTPSDSSSSSEWPSSRVGTRYQAVLPRLLTTAERDADATTFADLQPLQPLSNPRPPIMDMPEWEQEALEKVAADAEKAERQAQRRARQTKKRRLVDVAQTRRRSSDEEYKQEEEEEEGEEEEEDSDGVFEVQDILCKRLLPIRRRSGRTVTASSYEYLVSWAGFTSADDSFQPYANVRNVIVSLTPEERRAIPTYEEYQRRRRKTKRRTARRERPEEPEVERNPSPEDDETWMMRPVARRSATAATAANDDEDEIDVDVLENESFLSSSAPFRDSPVDRQPEVETKSN